MHMLMPQIEIYQSLEKCTNIFVSRLYSMVLLVVFLPCRILGNAANIKLPSWNSEDSYLMDYVPSVHKILQEKVC